MTHRITRRATVATASAGALALAAVAVGPLAGPGAAAGTTCPTRIVSLSPTATETLFAIGAGPRVVAVDNDSDYPTSAPRKPGLSGYTPSVESILTDYRPNLVIDSYDPGHLNENLKTARVRVMFQPTARTLRAAYQQILNLGTVTCHPVQARRVVLSMERRIASIRASAEASAHGLLYYDEVSAPPNPYAASSQSFVGQLFAELGMRNISNSSSSGGFPELSEEYIVATSPQLIFLSDNWTSDGGVTVQSVERRSRWATVRAVRTHSVYGLNDDEASRWGPRIPDLLRQIANDVRAYRAHH